MFLVFDDRERCRTGGYHLGGALSAGGGQIPLPIKKGSAFHCRSPIEAKSHLLPSVRRELDTVVCDVLVDISILVAFRLGMTDQNDHLLPASARSHHIVELA